jgi:hypothetical protein
LNITPAACSVLTIGCNSRFRAIRYARAALGVGMGFSFPSRLENRARHMRHAIDDNDVIRRFWCQCHGIRYDRQDKCHDAHRQHAAPHCHPSAA